VSVTLVSLVTAAYVGVAINEGWRRNWSDFTIFGGYAFANLGLIANLLAKA
jgi:ABC-type proline/glycine betaine transport system permease subunit